LPNICSIPGGNLRWNGIVEGTERQKYILKGPGFKRSHPQHLALLGREIRGQTTNFPFSSLIQ
jgi:hypothetical protein